MNDEQRFHVHLDTDLKQLVDADPRTNKEVTHAALWREFGGERKAAIDMRIEHMERREKMVRSEMEDLEEELNQIKSEKQALEHKREEMMTQDEAYEQDLKTLLSRLEEGELNRLTPELKDVKEVAEGTDHTPEGVWADAKQLAARQDRRINNVDFMTPTEAEKLRYDEVGLIGDTYDGGEDQ